MPRKKKSQKEEIFKTEQEVISDEQKNDSPSPFEVETREELPNMTEAPEVAPESDVKTAQVIENQPEIKIDEKKQIKKKINNYFSNACKESIILSALSAFYAYFSKLLRSSFTAHLFTSYKSASDSFDSSFLGQRLNSEKIYKRNLGFKRSFQNLAYEAAIPSALSRFTSNFFYIKTRIYAMMLLAFGAMTLFCDVFIVSNISYLKGDKYNIITGITIILLALLFTTHKGTVGEMLCESKIINLLFFKILGITPPQKKEAFDVPRSAAFIVGFILGAGTLFFPATSVVSTIMLVIYAVILFASPEAGMISIIVLAPFAPIKVLVFGIFVLSISYILKALVGKRTIHLEFMDILVIIFSVLVLLAENISFGTNSKPLTVFLFTAVYLITVSILRSCIWFERAKKAGVFICGLLALYGSFAVILNNFFPTSVNTNSFSGVIQGGNALTSFACLSVLMIPSLFIFISGFITSKTGGFKLLFALVIVSDIVFLYNVIPPSAWISVLIAVTVLTFLYKGKMMLIFGIAVIAVPFLPVFKFYNPEHLINVFTINEDKYNLWNAAIRMIFEHPFSGYGFRSDAFDVMYPSFFVGNTEHITNTGSLILHIAFSLGIVGVIVFVLFCFFLLQSSFSFGRSCTDKSSPERYTCYACMCGMISLLVLGIGQQIWIDPRCMLFFWILCGITASSRRGAIDKISEQFSETTLFYIND